MKDKDWFKTRGIKLIKEQLEEVIKKFLPEKKEIINLLQNEWGIDNRASDSFDEWIYGKLISQINTSLIADEVLKVVLENERQRIGQEMDLIWRDTHHDLNLFEQAICELQEDLLYNSSTLEGEQSEHLSPNKENE